MICLANEKNMAFGCGHMVNSKNTIIFMFCLHAMMIGKWFKCRHVLSVDQKFASVIYVEGRLPIVSSCFLINWGKSAPSLDMFFVFFISATCLVIRENLDFTMIRGDYWSHKGHLAMCIHVYVFVCSQVYVYTYRCEYIKNFVQ